MTGALVLIGLALRRERVAIPVWALSIAAMIALTASSLKRLYPTRADLVELASTVADNPCGHRDPRTGPRARHHWRHCSLADRLVRDARGCADEPAAGGPAHARR